MELSNNKNFDSFTVKRQKDNFKKPYKKYHINARFISSQIDQIISDNDLIQPPDGKFNNKVINVYILLKHQRLHVPKDKNDKLKSL